MRPDPSPGANDGGGGGGRDREPPRARTDPLGRRAAGFKAVFRPEPKGKTVKIPLLRLVTRQITEVIVVQAPRRGSPVLAEKQHP